ncbi:MAG: type II secretion system secretin GspD [Kofleriaceae bacterium]|nr:type II secretion system secretin GspD [Kofleriaceae bacterium]
MHTSTSHRFVIHAARRFASLRTPAQRGLATTLVAAILASLAPVSVRVANAQPTAATPTSSTPSAEDEQLYSCKKRTGQVAVTFKPETELKELITWVMGFTCKNFILDPRVVSTGKKFTLIAPNKMSASQAYDVFLVALSTMGLTVVPKGNVMRIVESATAKSETLPIYKKGLPGNQDQIVRYILKPTHAQIEILRQALDAIRSPAGSVQPAGSMLIITDYASQVRDMMSLARAIDIPNNADGIYTIPVKFADATTLAQKLNEILGVTAGSAAGGGGGGGAAGGGRGGGAPAKGAPGAAPTGDDVAGAIPSKILVDDRTNTLIVVSTEAGYYRVKALVDRLDISLDTEGGTSIRVHPLENALAEELATTLNAAIGQGTQQPGRQGQPGGQGGRGGPPPAAPAAAPGGGGGDLGSSLEGTVRVIGDKPTNSLIIMSSGRDYIAIKDVIRRLDQPRRQVFIEAMILEVQLSKGLNLGTSSHGGVPLGDNDSSLLIGGVQHPSLRSLDVSTLATATGLIGGLLGPLVDFEQLGTSIPSYGVLFQALATQDNANILSAPHVIAIDNEKAELSVGNNIPYQAGLSFPGFGIPGQNGAQGVPGSIGQNIQREKLNLTLNVTPHISSNDAVRLEIEQEIKDIGARDAQLGPTWTERKLKTQVVVRDQQSVVIGGLIQEKDIYTSTKVPLLGDIPILGYLFKYTTRTKNKTNLLILLTPYIIKEQLDLQAIRERKQRERDEFMKAFGSLNEHKYDPKIDYRRKRGLLEEINRSVLSVQADFEVLQQMGSRQSVQGGALDYAPSNIEDPGEPGSLTPPETLPPKDGGPAPKTGPAPKATPKATPPATKAPGNTQPTPPGAN